MANSTSRTQTSEQGPQSLPPKFPSPFLFNERDPVTLIELRMRKFSGMIRSKPSWWEKVGDGDLVAKWRHEIVEQDRAAVEELWSGDDLYEYDSEKKWPRDPISDSQLGYIFDQLKYEASQRDKATGIFVGFHMCRAPYQCSHHVVQ